MPLVITCFIHNWITITDVDKQLMRAFNAADIHFLEKTKNDNGLFTIKVYIHPANTYVDFIDVEEEAAEKVFNQLFSLAHKADKNCRDCQGTWSDLEL